MTQADVKLKPKPVDLYELECLQGADTFLLNNYETGKITELKDWADARDCVLNPRFPRQLVYGYNKVAEERSCSGRQVLITKRLIQVADGLNAIITGKGRAA